LSVLTEIHNRGVKDILIACVNGLTGFPNAIETVFHKTQVHLWGSDLKRDKSKSVQSENEIRIKP
jgi:transposase-like protein